MKLFFSFIRSITAITLIKSMCSIRTVLVITLGIALGSSSQSYAFQASSAEHKTPSNWHLKDIQLDEQNYYRSTSYDAYIVIQDLNLSKANFCGLVFDLELEAKPLTPLMIEIFWRSSERDFSESQKAFFLLNKNLQETRHQFVVPLCKLYNFSGQIHNPSAQANISAVRVDFPANKMMAMKINLIDFIDAKNTFTSSLSSIEPYERMSGGDFTSLDVVLPKLMFVFQHGFKRLLADKGFLFVWLCIILCLLLLILNSIFTKNENA